jgi:proline iminopeptidase
MSATEHTSARREWYPEVEPYDTGRLAVGDGNEIYFEQVGNPNGKPVVVLHGGPGGGISPVMRRVFHPDRYRIVLFDQRNCGKSTPHATDPKTDFEANTTWHLVSDIEKLREHLGIQAWQVFGGSWGSTLALAYAQTHTDRVTEVILRGIFTLRKTEIAWFYQNGASHLFPDFWEKYLEPIPEAERGDLVAAYHRRLFDPDPAVHVPAAVAWTAWENSTVRLYPDSDAIHEAHTDVASSVAFARIENHFFSNGGWMDDGQLLRDAQKLKDTPVVIVQGRYDTCTPAATAWELHRQLPSAEFHVIPDAGHSLTEPGIFSALLDATDKFARV